MPALLETMMDVPIGPDTAKHAEAGPVLSSHQGLGILLVEDNPIDALVVEQLLRAACDDAPISIRTVASLRSALSCYDAREHDVVLVDLSLPDAHGLDAVRAVLKRDPDATVVVITALADEQIGESALRMGAQDYLTKGGLTGLSLRRVVRYAQARKAAVRDSQERYRRIIEAALDAVVITDQAGAITDWNPRSASLFGWSRAEVIGRRLEDTIFPGRRGAPPANVREALNAVQELEARRRDGTLVPVEVAVSVSGTNGGRLYTAFIRDVTERRHADRQLRDEKALADSLIANLPGIFCMLDSAGRIIRWNRRLEETIGCAPGALLGDLVLDHVYPDDRRQVAGRIIDTFRDGQATIELRLRQQNGTPVPFYGTGLRVELDGKPCMLTIGVDLTERRAMEAQLVHAQKMEGIGRLAGGVAHDFNNMLAAVISFSELLLMDSPADDPRRGDVETIHEAALRATGLTRQLLAFSRRQVFTPRVTDLNGLIAGLDRMLRRLIGEDVEMVTLFGEHLGQVEVDQGQIESAIVNLVVNARDAMPSGGMLTLETSNVELKRDESAPDQLSGSAVRITVTDTGQGMDESVLRHLFEPFFTTKEPGKGTGLGLASVYGIVKQSGGQVAVSSAPGRGTCFTLDLPRVRAHVPVAADDVAAVVPRGTETVIVAEDNALVRRGIGATLAARGYRVLQAVNGAEALHLAEQHDGPIHLLLADVVMPMMPAQELCDRMIALRPDVRVIFMSGYMNDSVRSAAARVMDFVQKPFTSDVLARKVRAVLDQEI